MASVCSGRSKTYAIAFTFLKPGIDRLARLATERTNGNEMGLESQRSETGRFERRLRRWSLIQVALLVLAVAAMATARYLP